jgi:NADH-quinone oxidoreductase subunit M
VGAYKANSWVAAVATLGIILGAAYMLYLYARVVFGESKNADAVAMPDLNIREWLSLGPIALATIWMGVYPESFMAPMRKDVEVLLARLADVTPKGDAQLKIGKPKPKAGHGTEGAHH